MQQLRHLPEKEDLLEDIGYLYVESKEFSLLSLPHIHIQCSKKQLPKLSSGHTIVFCCCLILFLVLGNFQEILSFPPFSQV